jgi:membrane fusion protein (multidrug efflux system)
MFATVHVAVGAPHALITLPQTAVTYNPYGSTVFLVEGARPGHQTVRQVFVQTGATRGDQVAITKGLAAGDVVVVAGQVKLRNGTPVEINNSVLPADSANPTPEER